MKVQGDQIQGEVTMAPTLHGDLIYRDPVVMAAPVTGRARRRSGRVSAGGNWRGVDGTNEGGAGRSDGVRGSVLPGRPAGGPEAPGAAAGWEYSRSGSRRSAGAGIRHRRSSLPSRGSGDGMSWRIGRGKADAKGRTFFQVGCGDPSFETANDVRILRESGQAG